MDASYDVFISYSSRDSNWVHNWLLPQLEGEGLRVCIDFRDFDIGVPSIINIEQAVARSRKTLLVLTPNWLDSHWTDFEALMAQGGDPDGWRRRILPLLLEKTQLTGRLSIFTYADFTQPDTREFQVTRLLKAIRENTAPLPSPPPPPPPAPRPLEDVRRIDDTSRFFDREGQDTFQNFLLAEVIAIVSLMLAILTSSPLVPLTANYDLIILYAITFAIAYSFLCFFVAKRIRCHIWVATIGGPILLTTMWTLVRLIPR